MSNTVRVYTPVTIMHCALLPRAHAQRGKVIGSVVVVVVVSTKIARSTILREFASANCSQGFINCKKTCERASRQSKSDHESYRSCFLLVTPISHTHSDSNYLHMHALYSERSRTRTLAIDQYSCMNDNANQKRHE